MEIGRGVGVDGILAYATVIADHDRPGVTAVRVSPLCAPPNVNPHDLEKMNQEFRKGIQLHMRIGIGPTFVT